MDTWSRRTLRAIVDDDAEFGQETLRWLDNVYRFALSLTGNPADASNLVQETYTRAFKARFTFERGGDVRRWLFTICHNAFLPTRRRVDLAPVVLVDVEDQTYEDAAAILGVPIGTVRSRLFHARRLLRRALPHTVVSPTPSSL